jgi:hypothetical protein
MTCRQNQNCTPPAGRTSPRWPSVTLSSSVHEEHDAVLAKRSGTPSTSAASISRRLAAARADAHQPPLLHQTTAGAAGEPLQWRLGQPPLPNRTYKWCNCRGGWPAAPTNRFVGAAQYPAVPTIHFRNHEFSPKKYKKNSKTFFQISGRPPLSPSKSQLAAFFARKSHASRLRGIEPTTSPSHVPSSTTAPHSHLCLDMIIVPQILYQTKHKLIV